MKYAALRDEVQAVADGTEALAVKVFPRASIDADPLFQEFRQIASDLHLSVVMQEKITIDQDPDVALIYVFAARQTELWRIPAYGAFQRIFQHYDWSDAAEHFEGVLRGHSDAAIAQQLAAHAASRIDWAGKTAYLLLSAEHASNIRMLGMRGIDPTTVQQSIRIFCSRKHDLIRRDAASFIGEQQVLARVSIAEPLFAALFRTKLVTTSAEIVEARLDAAMMVEFNCALRSNFQFFEQAVWV